MISQEALLKLELKQPPLTGQEIYQFLTSLSQQGNMCTFKDFLRWYNNKDVVLTLEAMQKIPNFFTTAKEVICLCLDILCQVFPIFVHTNQLLQKFTNSQRTTKNVVKKRKDKVGGTSILFTQKSVVDETFNRDQTD